MIRLLTTCLAPFSFAFVSAAFARIVQQGPSEFIRVDVERKRG